MFVHVLLPTCLVVRENLENSEAHVYLTTLFVAYMYILIRIRLLFAGKALYDFSVSIRLNKTFFFS